MITLSLLISLASAQLPPAVESPSIYTIPAGEGLSEPMSFAFEKAQLLETNSSAELSFRLPALLDGPNAQVFTLKGKLKADQLNLSGEGAKADCAVLEDRTDCQIQFIDLKLDHAGADELATDIGGKVFADRVKVGREAFEHQAVGIITIFNEK